MMRSDAAASTNSATSVVFSGRAVPARSSMRTFSLIIALAQLFRRFDKHRLGMCMVGFERMVQFARCAKPTTLPSPCAAAAVL